MHRIFVQIGPFTVYTYGVLIAFAILVSVILIRRDCVKNGIPFDKILDCIVFGLIGGIAGARVLFVLMNLSYFLEYPLKILAFRDGGMAFQGGLVLGVVSALIACRLKNVGFWQLVDLVAPYIALSHAFGRAGCFFNGCCYGKVIERGIGVTFPGEDFMRLPTQLYSAFFLVLLFAFLLWFRKKRMFEGAVFSIYLIMYSFFRFFIEFLRGDNPRVFFGLTIPQALCICTFVAGLSLWVILSGAEKKES